VADIAEALGLDCALTVRVLDELREDGQLRGVEVAQDPYLLRIEPTAKARLELGQWPTRGDKLYDRFIAVLTERIAAELDEAKRTRLEKLLGVADDEGHQRARSPSSHVCLPGARASGLWSQRQRDRRI
jgi:DNA-binding MarR family transcriptional regulator